VDKDNIPLTIKGWILTVTDCNNHNLFLQVAKISDTMVELQVLSSNLSIANKWARHNQTHISRVFHELPTFSHEVDFWEPPTKPDINLMQTTGKQPYQNYYRPTIFNFTSKWKEAISNEYR
jgi:hypothetical protein